MMIFVAEKNAGWKEREKEGEKKRRKRDARPAGRASSLGPGEIIRNYE